MTARPALCAFVLIGLCQPSLAAGPQYCHRYASNAVRAQQSNIHYRCGFTGRRWSTDYRDHFGWCIQAPWAAADREESLRRRSLRRLPLRLPGGRYPPLVSLKRHDGSSQDQSQDLPVIDR